MSRKIFLSLTSIFLFSLLIPVSFTTCTKKIEVEPLSSETLTFNMTYGKIFQCSLSVFGDDENSINFWVTNPDGKIILNLGRVTQNPKRFEFFAFKDGEYTLHFDNSFSSLITKEVSLMYEIFQDQMLPAFFSGFVVCLFAPIFIKHFLKYEWMKTFAFSSVAVIITIVCVGMICYKPLI